MKCAGGGAAPAERVAWEVKTGGPGAGRVRRCEQLEGDRAGRVEAAAHRRRVEMDVPTGPPAEGVVAMAGVAWVMVTGSAAQPELTAALLASPL